MRFLVYGRDGHAFDFGPSDRHEAHQAYMDRWLSHLIGRGPTLSPDGSDHTGSVHVIEVADADTARGFAFQEPYAQAGWYADVSVHPMLPGVAGTMWDRPVPDTGHPASFVRATWPFQSLEDLDVSSLNQGLTESTPEWLFAGLVLTDDLACSSGFAGAIDLSPDEAIDQLRKLVIDTVGPNAEIEVHRWRRGGRTASP